MAAAGLRQAIVAAVASGSIGLPARLDPSTLFHLVEQRVERGEREFKSASGALANLPGDLESVQRLLGK